MKRIFAILVALVVVAFGAQQVLARGGHGGGHHGGGHHGGHHGNHHSNHHHSHHGNHHHAHHGHHGGWGGGGWGGWGGGWGGWGAGWGLGWGAAWAPVAYGTAAAWIGSPETTTVYTSDTAADDTQDDVVVDGQDTDATKTLAEQGAIDPAQDAKLLPLGVYTLAPKGQEESTSSVRLALDKNGVLRGIYYDSLGAQGHPIRGAVDKKTQRVAWTVGDNKKVLFQTTLASLTHEKGALTVRDANGNSHPWTIARFEKNENEEEPAENDAPAAPKAQS